MTGRAPFLSAFAIPSFRYQWPADLLSSWALEMEVLILNWYVALEFRSATISALFAGLQYFGSLIAPGVGALADRFGRKRTLATLRALYATLALVLMALDLMGALTPLLVFIIAGVAGLIRPSDLVMRNALIGDTMPSARLANAMGLSRMTMDSARLAGAIVGAGLLVALGLGWAYAVIAAFYLASFALTLRVAHVAVAETPAVRPHPFREVVEGLRYVIRAPAVLALMWLAFLVNFTGFPLVSSSGILSIVALKVYGLDATGLAHLAASFGIGSLAASIVMAATGGARRPVVLTFLGLAAWHLLLIAYAFTETKTEGLIVLGLIGVAQGVGMISMAVALLRLADARVRGRVMGARMLAVYGLPLGLAVIGPLTDVHGFRETTLVAATFGLFMIAVIAARWRRALFGPGVAAEP